MTAEMLGPDRYWDLAKYFEANQNYRDFEGFTTAKDVLEIVDDPEVRDMIACFYNEGGWQREMLRDMVIHYVFECIEQAEAPSKDILIEVVAAMGLMLNCRWVMKSTAV